MNNKIAQTIEKFNMLSVGDTVLLGVSGGADSMLMLEYFNSNKEKYGISIKVAHIEHGIRGESSVTDARFVEEYCNRNNIEFRLLRIDAIAESKAARLGVEEYSRIKRYEFFDTIECDKIATAHNLTDNIETLIQRLARGTGLKGVCGIPAVRGKIIRPLIEISADEIRKYCDDCSIAYRIDSTNFENTYSRNKIRNEILPILLQLNSGYTQQLSYFFSDINEDNDFIEKCVADAYLSAFADGVLLTDTLLKLDTAILKRVIKKYFSDYNILLDRLHLCQIAELVGKSGRLQISGNYYAIANKKCLRLAELCDTEFDFNFVSQILNINEFNEKDIDFYCDYDKIVGSVTARMRLSGDTIKPAGRNCEKTIKKLFNELSIPVEKRSQIPVICDEDGVIGIAGYCVDERVRLDKNTKNVITIKFPVED